MYQVYSSLIFLNEMKILESIKRLNYAGNWLIFLINIIIDDWKTSVVENKL
jgi:hypothetical protein